MPQNWRAVKIMKKGKNKESEDSHSISDHSKKQSNKNNYNLFDAFENDSEENKGDDDLSDDDDDNNPQEKKKKKKKQKYSSAESYEDIDDDDDEDIISSSCHTSNATECSYVQSENEDSDDDDESIDSYDDSDDSSDGDLHYEGVYEIHEQCEEGLEWEYWVDQYEEFQEVEKYIKKKLTKLPEPKEVTPELFKEGFNIDISRINRVFKLFMYNKKRVGLTEDDSLNQMNTYSLFYRSLLVQMLDPHLEMALLSSFLFYLMGYKIKGFELTSSFTAQPICQKILNFLYIYTIKNPQAFFFKIQKNHIIQFIDESEEENKEENDKEENKGDKNSNQESEDKKDDNSNTDNTTENSTKKKQKILYNIPDEFTIAELLIKYLLIDLEKGEIQFPLITHSLQRMIVFLFEVRYHNKDENKPKLLQTHAKNSILAINHDLLQEIIDITNNLENLETKAKPKYFYSLLALLANEPQFVKKIIIASEQLLTQSLFEECSLLQSFIENSKKILETQKAEEKPSNENSSQNSMTSSQEKNNNQAQSALSSSISTETRHYFINFLSQQSWKLPNIMGILKNIIGAQTNLNEEMTEYLSNSKILSQSLQEAAYLYMEALEQISKLKDKEIIKQIGPLKIKIKKMLEVPIQFYQIHLKIKDHAQEKKLNIGPGIGVDDLSTYQIPTLKKKVTVEIQAPIVPLNRTYSEIIKENSSYGEVMTQWMGRCRNFINEVFKVSTSDIYRDESSLAMVKKFPWLIDLSTKERILRESFENKTGDFEDETTMYIRRQYILEDTLKEFAKYTEEKLYFRIEFVKEPGVDQGGLKKEWLNLLTKDLFGPRNGLFKLAPNNRTIHPNPFAMIQPGVSSLYKLAGNLAAIAIKDQIAINVNFSKSFLKLILGIMPNINDLDDIEPELTQSLKWIMENEVDGLEQPFMYEIDAFGSRTVQELKENGENIIVDEANKAEYIDLMQLTKTYREVSPYIEKFKEGFFEVIPEELIEIFSPAEIEILICGKTEIDLEDLKKYTKYKEISKDDKLVVWFWEILETMDQDTLANVLFFITGSSQVPHGGFKEMPLTIRKGEIYTTNLPVAHTCFLEIEIPQYQSKEQLHEKLFVAILEGKEGFHIA